MTASSRLIGERRSGLPPAKVQSPGTPKPRRELVTPTPFLTEFPALSSLLVVLQSHGLLINPWAGAPESPGRTDPPYLAARRQAEQ